MTRDCATRAIAFFLIPGIGLFLLGGIIFLYPPTIKPTPVFTVCWQEVTGGSNCATVTAKSYELAWGCAKFSNGSTICRILGISPVKEAP